MDETRESLEIELPPVECPECGELCECVEYSPRDFARFNCKRCEKDFTLEYQEY